MVERVVLTTSDEKTIVGDYSGQTGQPAVLLLHMMPATRESWRTLAEKLKISGFQTLAVDLRGHGQSQGGPSEYKRFSNQEHQSSIRDVEAAVDFLKSKNPSKIFIAGASIGANLALWYIAEHPDVRGAILLSPGLDYRGIKTAGFIKKLRDNQVIFYAAGRDDTYSAETVESLAGSTSEKVEKRLRMFEKAGHGTTILEKEPEFMDELVDWLSAA